jgi:hypothetical protein
MLLGSVVGVTYAFLQTSTQASVVPYELSIEDESSIAARLFAARILLQSAVSLTRGPEKALATSS